MRGHPTFAIHPGERVSTDVMQPLGRSSDRPVKEIGAPAPRVHDVLLGRRSMTANTAPRFGRFFHLPARFRLTLQNDDDLRLAATDVLPTIKPDQAV